MDDGFYDISDFGNLPDNIVKQVLDYLNPSDQYLFASECRSVSAVAQAALYTHLVTLSREKLDRLMECRPDPDEIAGHVEYLEIPGALDSPAKEYIERLVSKAHNMRRLKVGRRDSQDPRVLYIPALPANHRVRNLIVGAHIHKSPTKNAPMVSLDELRPFHDLTSLRWLFVDRRLGTFETILRTINEHCPELRDLEVPWSDEFDGTWDDLPTFSHLERITIIFEHESKIAVPEFVNCLREFYNRGIHVRVGMGCAQETYHWLQDMYAEIFHQEQKLGNSSSDIMRWLLQRNDHHLVKLTNLRYRGMKEEMYKKEMCEAVRQLDTSDGEGVRLEIDIDHLKIPEILLLGKARVLRLIVNRENLPASFIPTILKANPLLRSNRIFLHVHHYGATHDGNFTENPVPILPGQNELRNDGRSQRFTVPGVELLLQIIRDEDGTIKHQWKSYPRVRRGPPPTANELSDLNVYGLPNRDGGVWSEELLARLRGWQDEILKLMELAPQLRSLSVLINTDPSKYGRVEKYWCTCNDIGYV